MTVPGEEVKIYNHNHAFKHMPTPIAEQGFNQGGIVENNVWVGRNVILLKGCEIGDNSIIAAEAVVNKKYIHIQYIEEIETLKRLCQVMANTRK